MTSVRVSPLRFRLLGLLAVVLLVSILQLFVLDTTTLTYDWNVNVQEALSTANAINSSVNSTFDIANGAVVVITQTATLSNEKYCVESAAYPLEYTNYSKKNRTVSHFMVQETFNKIDEEQPLSAICRFLHDVPFSRHFPHAAQQLYRCWSWWRHQQQLHSHVVQVTPVLQLDQSKVPVHQNPFLEGFIRLLEGSLPVEFISGPNNVTVDNVIGAHAKLDDGFIYDYTMASSEDAKALREAAVRVFDVPNATGCHATNPQISILNRRSKRHVVNWEVLKDTLDSFGSVSVDYFEEKTFRDQLFFMMNTDILVSPHGAQLASLPFLPPCASVMEIFPTGYYEPAFFGSLAAASGVPHSFVYLGTNRTAEVARGSANVRARTATRKARLCPPVEHMKEAVEQAVVAWKQCCEQHAS